MGTNILKKKSGVIILFLMSMTLVYSQNSTKVTITGGLYDKALKMKIERNAGTLLTEFNNASVANRNLNLPDGLTNEIRSPLLAMWETSKFRCPETNIQEPVLKNIKGGYEIRNIPVIVKDAKPDNQYQEVAIIFDGNGNVSEVYYTLEMNQYLRLAASSDTVADYRRRQVIIDFLEKFRTAYNRKDIGLISDVYSEDALIIVGNVVKQQKKAGESSPLNGLPETTIKYIRLSKENYIENLKSCFATNKYINIRFSDIELVRHQTYPEIYGVTLKQNWSSTKYSDVGFLFLMIDFKNEDKPLITVRTWQPEKDEYGRIKTDTSNRFQLGNFDVIR